MKVTGFSTRFLSGLHKVYSQIMASTDLFICVFIYLFVYLFVALSTRVECLSRGYADSPGDELARHR